MSFFDYAIGTAVGLILGGFSQYFIQRYFYKKVMDRLLDKGESHIKKLFGKKEGQEQEQNENNENTTT